MRIILNQLSKLWPMWPACQRQQERRLRFSNFPGGHVCWSEIASVVSQASTKAPPANDGSADAACSFVAAGFSMA